MMPSVRSCHKSHRYIFSCEFAIVALTLSAVLFLLPASNPAQADDASQFPITATSIHQGDYKPIYAMDGDHATRWASSIDGPQDLTIDFGSAVSFDKVCIEWERAVAIEYTLQISDDGKTWKDLVQAKHPNKDPNADRKPITHDKLGARARYFRIHCTKADQWKLYSIFEIEFPGSQIAETFAKRRREAEELAQKQHLRNLSTMGDRLDQYGCEEIVFAMRQPGRDGHWYANFGYYSDDENRITYGDGGKLVRLNLKTGRKMELLTDPKGAVRDPYIHYDAEKILFSYRPGGTKYYHLYEINIDGTGLRQITDGPFDDIEPIYLPDGDILFISSRCKRFVNCWLTKVAVLYRCRPDGSNIQEISSNNEHDNTPWLLPSGQFIYTRWEYVDRSQVDYHHLWIANPDGSRQTVFFGNLKPSTTMIDAKPIPDSRKIVVSFSPGHGRREHEGVITVLDPRAGPDEPSMGKPIHPSANFRDPWAFSETLFMAARGTDIVMLDDQQNVLPIYQCTPEEKQAGLQAHEPRPLKPHPREEIIAPITDWKYDKGRVALIDVYEGRNMTGVKRGDIKKLLILETLPKPINFTGGMDPLTYGGSFTLERVVGEVPVEPDGSAYFELPALRSFFFVALDENNLSVKRMQSFMTVMPGETFTCVGCHEQRTTTPQHAPNMNRQAFSQPPNRLTPIADCPDVFDFPRDIQPILDRLCVDCHGPEKTARGGPYDGKVLLTGDHGPMFSHAYFTMTVKQLFSDGRNRPVSNYSPRSLGSSASRILKMIDGSHYGVKATEHERKMLRLWIEVGAPYPGTYAALGCGAIGGYNQNNQNMNNDKDWPTSKAGAEVIASRCASCHTGNDILPRSMSDERGLSFWRFDMEDPRLKLSRHIVFNLTKPERSLIAIAPLSKKAGGLELCRDDAGKPVVVFKDTSDPDFQTLVAMARAGQQRMAEVKRFDMPDFRPMPQWVREMKHYGILPEDLPADAEIDVYETERRYWQSLWYKPQ